MMRDGYELRPYGRGKFDTIMDSLVFERAIDDAAEREENDADLGIFHLSVSARPLRALADDAPVATHERRYQALTIAERLFLTSRTGGCIVQQQPSGAVTVTYFTTDDARTVAWREVEATYRQLEEADD